MAQALKKKNAKDFVPMERTRVVLKELWDQWLDTLDHTPNMAKRMMTAAINEMHKTAVAGEKKAAAKKTVKKAVRKVVAKKAKAVRRKMK